MTDAEHALAEELVGLAQRLSRERDEPLAALEALAYVSEVAGRENGTRRALAEVAEAFLRVIARGHAGREALAVHRFLRNEPEHGRNLLRRTLTVSGLPAEELEDKERQVLISAGVLTQHSEHVDAVLDVVLRVTPHARGLVRDACEPLTFRLWRTVEEAREAADNAYYAAHPSVRHSAACADEAAALVERLGCTNEEARKHLESYPLRGR